MAWTYTQYGPRYSGQHDHKPTLMPYTKSHLHYVVVVNLPCLLLVQLLEDLPQVSHQLAVSGNVVGHCAQGNLLDAPIGAKALQALHDAAVQGGL